MYRPTWFNAPQMSMTKQLVCQHLLAGDMARLDLPLAFGDGLTDCTYMEWIRDKARRLFLILADLGVPDQIFRLIDEGWEDDDLPIPQDQVDRLHLPPGRNAKPGRDFYHLQYYYLVRLLERGQHLDYQDDEVVPILHAVERRPVGLAQDAVHLPNLLGKALCRRRVPLRSGSGGMSEEELLAEVRSIKDIQHQHMACYWGSYTHQGIGYVLFTPLSEYKLSAYYNNTIPCIKSLDGPTRRRMIFDWVHCMTNTVCLVHSTGASLGNIKPSTIYLTHDCQVVFSGPSWLADDDAPGRHFDREVYDYAAPELCARHGIPVAAAPRIRNPSDNHSHNNNQYNFSINRGGPTPAPTSDYHASHQQQHHHHGQTDPQAADIFSLGCVLLELLGHGLVKRTASAFRSARSTKHKSAGRGGAVPDASFHRNLGPVEAWMAGLARDASKKVRSGSGSGPGRETERDEKSRALACVPPLLRVVERMLAANPAERPSAVQVRAWVVEVLAKDGGAVVLTEPHCAFAQQAPPPPPPQQQQQQQQGRRQRRARGGLGSIPEGVSGGRGEEDDDDDDDDDDYDDDYHHAMVRTDSNTLPSLSVRTNHTFLDTASPSGSEDDRDDISRRAPSSRHLGSSSSTSGRSGWGSRRHSDSHSMSDGRSTSGSVGGASASSSSHGDRWNPPIPMLKNMRISPSGKLWNAGARSFADSAVSMGS